MLESCNTLSINDDLACAMSVSRVLKFGNCTLQLKRFQIFDREFWDDVREHTHPFFELLAVLKGALRYSIENHYVHFGGNPKKILLIPPGIPHDRSLISGDDLIVIIQFSMTPADSAGVTMLEDLHTELSKRHYELELDGFIDFNAMIGLCQTHPPLWQERLLSRFENFLLEFFAFQFGFLFAENRLQRKNMESRGTRIKRLEQIVEITLDAHLRLEEYAARLGISSRQIERLIKQHHNMPFSQYVRMRRLEAARKMLSSPFSSIKNIANTLGYDDFSYFCRTFRVSVGCSPGEYARHVRENQAKNMSSRKS